MLLYEYDINRHHVREESGLRRKRLLWILVLMLLSACGKEDPAESLQSPYQGMVQVASGYGTQLWVELHEDVALNTLNDPADFVREKGRVTYTGAEVESLQGIDVSEHQGAIDWAAVAADGIDFAVIRAGYRGYSEGGLFEDSYFRDNLKGAAENNIPLGLYFFSQATSVKEAEEEAAFLLAQLKAWKPDDFALPIFYDWETIHVENARTDDVPPETVTACAKAFCEAIAAAGYSPGVYAYRYLGYFTYDLAQLSDYPLWMGAVGDSPDFFYRHSIWQYTINGRVNGIRGDVDMNLMFLWKESGETYGGDMAYLPGNERGVFLPLETELGEEIQTLLNGKPWKAGEACACETPLLLKSGEKVLRYCEDCGAFYDEGRVLSLERKAKKKLNGLLEDALG